MSVMSSWERESLESIIAQQQARIRALEAAVPVAQFNIKVKSDNAFLTVANGQFIFLIPDDLDGATLITATAYVTTPSSSGKPTVRVTNLGLGGGSMFSTLLTIDVSEYSSYTAAVPVVINPTYASVAKGYRLQVDVTVAGTGAKGLGLILEFS